MKIRSRLILSVIVFCIITLVISVAVSMMFGRINELNARSDRAQTLVLESHELSDLSTDYILFREQRQYVQWKAKYISIGTLLKQLQGPHPEQRALVDSLAHSYKRIKVTFDDVRAQLGADSGSAKIGGDIGLLRLSWARLTVQVQGMIHDASRLSHFIEAERRDTERRSFLLVSAMIITLVLFVVINYIFIYWRVLRSIEALNKGTTQIGEGNLNYRIDESGKDEMAEVACAFNRMSANLVQVMASKEDLDREIQYRKKIEEALRKNEELLNSTGSVAKVGGWEVDAQTLEVTWTDQTYRIDEVPEGYKPPLEEAINFYHEEDRETLSNAIRRGLDDGEPYDLVLRFNTAKGNSLWVRAICQPEVVDGKTVKLRGTFQDITDLRQAQDALQRANEELVAANRDLEAFSYSVSHDLRAPLRVINRFAEMISTRHRATLNDEGRTLFDMIMRNTTQMNTLIDTLLDYSLVGRKSVSLQPVNLRNLLGTIVETLSESIKKSGAELSIAEDMPLILGDDVLLRQVFTNLLNNAIIYRRTEVPLRIVIGCAVVDGHAIIEVSDNGIGIPSENHDKIFEVFQRLWNQDDYPGTGIGLAIVKKSVELMGCQVWVESHVDQGSTFFVKLPRAQ